MVHGYDVQRVPQRHRNRRHAHNLPASTHLIPAVKSPTTIVSNEERITHWAILMYEKIVRQIVHTEY